MGADQKRREARKRKFGVLSTIEESDRHPVATNESRPVDAERQDSRKKQRRSSVATFAQIPTNGDRPNGHDENSTVPVTAAARDDQQGVEQQSTEAKGQRFIVFIGNLPFTASDDSISKHFAKVHPQSIRHRTDKATGKSKGFAFLEFEAYDRMKTCLKVYHHSTFDDGLSPARRLNVELTVGGGGAKSKDRKAKLRLKNVKLTEERQRRAQEVEKHAKTEIISQNSKSVKKTQKTPSNVGGESTDPTSGPVDVHGDIHPSRRNRLLLT